MTDKPERSKEEFLYPRSSYRGEFSPGKLAFNANLQEFAQKTAYICGLETNGKISSEDAYQKIKKLWHQLKSSRTELLNFGDADPES